ncbi:hypothetical protein [Alteraurantiacibacter buctensis]|uniref:Uncharacterized protein n=1 Tax=Alteraurantiacibacter buctensis TaxID=1503981 RepID=A0A844Z5V2_9SPHN|nr:hypothetical protein [Alteraurantiacibacter buctensis]MXO73183.1 hypothetical protein [Alteraurantiacibacter buctensis]
MRGLVLAGLLLVVPAAAQEHRPPEASVAGWSLAALPAPSQVAGNRTGLSASQAAFSGILVPAGDFMLETTLAYRNLADGDVAGIALRGTNGGWISLQLEQITPALLLAVRQHVPGGIDAHGRLLETIAVSGWHDGTIRLWVERRGGLLRFAHAPVDGEWQHLGGPFAGPAGEAAQLGLFAVDGAER